jgi:hypothetical protein
MKRDFYFRRMDVGRFTSDDLPCTAGRYSYEPVFVPHIPREMWLGKPTKFPPSGDVALRKALSTKERPICYYYTKDARVFFRVSACPGPGILELCDFESQPWPVPSILALQLAGIYQELVERRPFSDIARVPLGEATARGRALRLVVFQCDSEYLFLAGNIRRWWVIDNRGWHPDGEWPVTTEQLRADDGQSHLPIVKFATDGRRVRFGMRLG